MRLALYFALKMIKYDVDSQRSGVVIICWMHKKKFNDFKVRSYCHKQLIPALPWRINVVHCHSSPSDAVYQPFANTGKKIFLLAIGSKLRKRVRIHKGA